MSHPINIDYLSKKVIEEEYHNLFKYPNLSDEYEKTRNVNKELLNEGEEREKKEFLNIKKNLLQNVFMTNNKTEEGVKKYKIHSQEKELIRQKFVKDIEIRTDDNYPRKIKEDYEETPQKPQIFMMEKQTKEGLDYFIKGRRHYFINIKGIGRIRKNISLIFF